MTDPLIGKQIGDYHVLDIIGRGGMATVYRAQQRSMNRVVALKVLPEQFVNDTTFLQRFQQEVAIVALLEHRNIIPVYSYGEHEGRPYIAMRYMNGGSLDAKLRHGSLEIEDIVRVYDQIAPALDYAHSKKVLHRDIKPSNVLLDDDGGAYLTDFGIARVMVEAGRPNITTTGVVGTPSYMSPEQAQGHELDNRSDIYALGIMLFELATGRRPFESETPYSIAVMQVTSMPPAPRSYNPQLSLAVEEVILKALKKRREERYPHAIGLAEALKRAARLPTVSMHDTQPGGIRIEQTAPHVALPPTPLQPTPQPFGAPAPFSTPIAYQATPVPRQTGEYPHPPKKPKRETGLLTNIALGGVFGCGGLVVLAIIAMLIISALQTRGAEPTSTPALPTGEVLVTPTLVEAAALPTVTPLPLGTLNGTSVLPIGARTPEPLTATGGAKMIVYFDIRDDNTDIYSFDLATRVETRLTFDAKDDLYPVISPDGQWIAFVSKRDGDFDVYLMDLEGKNLRQVTNNNWEDRLPAWSPDGSTLVFASNTDNQSGVYDLYTIKADGSGLNRVFSNGMLNSRPSYSPDGRYLVFTTGNINNNKTWEIVTLDLQNGDLRQLTTNNYVDRWPSFSPDGQSILFMTSWDGTTISGIGVGLMNRDGSNARIIFDGVGVESNVSFSPDGLLIGFNRTFAETGKDEIFFVNLNGEAEERVTTGGAQALAWVKG